MDGEPIDGVSARLRVLNRMAAAMRRAYLERSGCAVLFLALDGLPAAEARHGRRAADELLAAATVAVEAAIGSEDAVLPLQRGELAVVLERLPSVILARIVARRIRDRVAEPQVLQGRYGRAVAVEPGVVSGFAWYPDDGTSVGRLLNAADDVLATTRQLTATSGAPSAERVTRAA